MFFLEKVYLVLEIPGNLRGIRICTKGVRKIAPRSWSGFGLGLALELGLARGGQFSSGAIFPEPVPSFLSR